jgi:1,4-alpha-glucan branching enzyme
LDYGRPAGEWLPNKYGGRENLEAVDFLKKLNERVYANYPDTMTMAEESTAWPQVSRPTYLGGLGFGLKWDMGWMHDTLKFMSLEPIYRKFHHNQLTFRGLYAFSENFVLPLSHDEVVYGKRSLLNKMPGDNWQKFANLRLLLAHMFTTPAKKLLFMGGDFGQWHEWNHEQSLDWHLLESKPHQGIQKLVKDLNELYRKLPALYEQDCNPAGFEWIDCQDVEQSVLTFLRLDKDHKNPVLVICNFTPIVRYNYMVGVPEGGFWQEMLNTDSTTYGGTGVGNFGGVESNPVPMHGRKHMLTLTLPPLSVLVCKTIAQT